ncbi:MAG: ATP-binding cassette domain-containing protein [Anaerolineales bacterium]|nr:MAG: ATP-binding cassette domain-containing protein [Anaerolineales bacterium]
MIVEKAPAKLLPIEIEVDSISFTYPSGIQALEDITIHVSSGERVALIGQNGAGKTTLVKHLNGLLKPVSGSVKVGSWDTHDHSVAQMATRVGYVFQNPDDQLFQRTVWDEMMFGPRNLRWSAERAASSVQASLEMVGLEHIKEMHPYDLTFSSRKLLALASVLAMDTQVVIIDEPTTGQDYRGVQQIGSILSELNKQGKTIIGVTHDIDFCAEQFERSILMAGGRVVLDGSTRQVLSQISVIDQAYVEAPQLMRLAEKLGWDFMPLTVEEFIHHLDG